MTKLTLDTRNLLVQVPEVKALISANDIGKGVAWTDGWLFSDYPYAAIEKASHKALIVITQNGTWAAANGHNTVKFPRMFVDIWASPTRKSDGSVMKHDADTLIEDVMAALTPYLHTVNPAVPGNSDLDPTLPYLGKPGHPRIWGTAAQIADRTGTTVISSLMIDGPDFSDVQDGNGARMGRYTFNVTTL